MSKVLRVAKDLFDIFYPIGSYYETSNLTWTPQGAGWYGTWVEDSAGTTTAAKDDGTFKNVGSVVGEETHVLTQSELPKIEGTLPHMAYGEYKLSGVFSWGAYAPQSQFEGQQSTANNKYAYKMSFGNNQPHNNIQPTLVVRRWHRTA